MKRPRIKRINTSIGLEWYCTDFTFAGFGHTPLAAWEAWQRLSSQVFAGVSPVDDDAAASWNFEEDWPAD